MRLTRSVGAQALSPGLDGLMVDYPTGIHISQGLAGQAAALLFLVEPGGQGLFDDPVFGALQALGNLIDTFGQLDRDVSGDGSGFGCWAMINSCAANGDRRAAIAAACSLTQFNIVPALAAAR